MPAVQRPSKLACSVCCVCTAPTCALVVAEHRAASELRAAGSGGNTNPLAAFEPDVQKFYRALHQQG